ncbi:MAG: ergothioneine biosynthesis protein EgtB [Betaproteobacteria bacterium]
MTPPPTTVRRYAAVRAHTEALVRGLSEADCQAQAMPDASPVKWHLAHTTWFFETFVLEAHEAGFRAFEPAYRVLFNSYYQAVGERHPRPQRGLVTRPGLAEVMAYRRDVDARMAALLARQGAEAGADDDLGALVELGLQHEQQHQELIATDFLHLLSLNLLQPAWHPGPPPTAEPLPLHWVPFDGGLVRIGHAGEGFAFDNETPAHRVWLEPYALASRLVTQGEWAAFISAGGYREPRWWLAAGWDWVAAHGIEAPLHWRAEGAGWTVFTPHGRHPADPHAPVRHLSLFEADAYARWAGARLPTEAEWEHAVASAPGRLAQAHGTAWQWTSSAYAPYPGFRPWDGAVGEYNGKFMVDQTVLRGSSWATPPGHARDSYRNFFPATARWQFTGLRLARDARG